MCPVKYGLFQFFSFLSKKLTGLYPVGATYEHKHDCGKIEASLSC